MLDTFFAYLALLDNFLWSYLGFTLIALLGTYLTLRFRFAQLLKFHKVTELFFSMLGSKASHPEERGVHPLSAFFASIGGCIGVGNIVAVCTAVQIGGPGAIFWIWVAAFLGMLIKYSEVYLGVKFRIPDAVGGYNGGPMFYLQRVFRTRLVPVLVAVFLAIYGTEIYMFNVVTDSIVTNFEVPHGLVVAGLLFLVFYAAAGGVDRVGKLSSVMIPLFIVSFLIMSSWVLFQNSEKIVPAFGELIRTAFSGHAAVGAFAGSGVLLTISQGMARGSYTGDIGVGYASVVQAEGREADPKQQASLAIFGIFLDTFVICSLSTLLVFVTGVWQEPISAAYLVQTALARYFPYMNFFMPFFLFLLGYSTIIAFFVVGLKCAKFLSPRWGSAVYHIYATIAFIVFSYVDQTKALTIMSISGACLVVINLYGIFKLRKEIEI
ncbi:MAG: sodium:alanine symporter family protein [Deltaproteobacteria bacterium]|nr:sodium:alanine symporter family protein [Deltaproteobacteria bacterium]